MTVLKLLFGALVAFGGFLLLIYLAQRSLMYFPERSRTMPAAAGLPEAEELVLDTADGEKVIAWHIPPKGEHPIVLYFHGNGGSLRLRAGRFRALTAGGLGLLALSYRGYGGSTGSPTERGLIADAEAIYAYAAVRYPAERIALWGESLGSGVAVALAASHKVARVLLEAPFTSAADVGAKVYWFVPVRLMMKDQFRSDLRIRDVKAPILILHGTKDGVVPFELGQRLFRLANGPKNFLKVEGGGHTNLDGFGGMDAARAFMSAAH
jgi:fermentation-respiration switch protein FrsA (DUF1100 family)